MFVSMNTSFYLLTNINESYLIKKKLKKLLACIISEMKCIMYIYNLI